MKLLPRLLVAAVTLGLSLGAAASYHALDVKEFDRAVSPCRDLDAFVNARWLAANPIPDDQTRWGAFNQLREKSLQTQHAIAEEAAAKLDRVGADSIDYRVGAFYRAGMDEAAIAARGYAPIKAELAQIAALRDGAAVAAYLRERHARGLGGVFGFYASADYKNAARQIAYARQGGLGLPTAEYYSKPEHAALRDAYVAHVARLLQLVDVPAEAAQQQAQAVMALETRLAKASLSPVELRKPENQYHFVSVAEADRLTPHFSWSAYLAAQGVDAKDGFSLSQPGFFAALDTLLAEVPAADWQAYLRYHAVEDAADYLAPAFAEESFAFYGKTLSGQPQMKPRWKRVLDSTNEALGMALGELYVARAFSPEAKQRMNTLVQNLRLALKARLEHLEWMSEATRRQALAKWETFLPKVGYPDTWRDWKGLALKPDDYYGNALAAAKFNHDWQLAKAGKPTDRQDWGMTPQTVNAYYRATDNTINFPAAILQPPFFDPQADDAVNYGGIGAVIGHEMMHGYDDKGSQFDAQGNNANWWTQDDREKFEARTALLGAQFDAYEPLPGLHINGALTMGENIADLGGITIAYDALQLAQAAQPRAAARKIDGYTPAQRFFLNWARVWRGQSRPEALRVQIASNPHAPERYRAIAAPSNLPAFAAAFACKAGDTMVRAGDKQVKIW
ncbi:MAG TPA: M13-type metalloendopeptidase [Rhodanobacteraceae bacterium]|nr:M13-type metalloendopeptidase [Rhodanobacteraceae bacterium]